MQVMISSARPSAALLTQSASASSGRAMEMRSASPAASTCSAISGRLMRFDAHTGVVLPSACSASLSFRVVRSEEHTSELQSRRDLVCRLLLEKKKIGLTRGHGLIVFDTHHVGPTVYVASG